MGLHMPLEQYLYSSIVCRTTCYEQNDGQHLSGYHLQGIPVRNHPQGWGIFFKNIRVLAQWLLNSTGY